MRPWFPREVTVLLPVLFVLASVAAPSADRHTLPLAGTGFTEKQTDRPLYWSATHRLGFTDFRGQPAAGNSQTGGGSTHLAGGIVKSIVADSRPLANGTAFIVYASMIPARSFIRKAGDSISLRHEQGHFDLCEIYARRLRHEMRHARSVDDGKKMWADVSDAEEREQERYDSANTYRAGGITPAWAKLISQRLARTTRDADPEVVVPQIH